MQNNYYPPQQQYGQAQDYGTPQQQQQGYGMPNVTSLPSDPYEELNKGRLLGYKFACVFFAVYCSISVISSILTVLDKYNALRNFAYIDIVMFGVGAAAGLMGFLANHNKDLPKAKLAFYLFIAHFTIYICALTYVGFVFDTLGSLLPSMIIRTIVFTLIYLHGSITSQQILEKAAGESNLGDTSAAFP